MIVTLLQETSGIIISVFLKDRSYKEELLIVYCTTHLMLADYFTKTLQGVLFHKSRDTIMGMVILFSLHEDLFSYTRKYCVRKQTPPKENSLGTGEPLKETKDMLEGKNDKHIRKIAGEPLKNKEILGDENNEPVCTKMGEPLKKKYIF